MRMIVAEIKHSVRSGLLETLPSLMEIHAVVGIASELSTPPPFLTPCNNEFFPVEEHADRDSSILFSLPLLVIVSKWAETVVLCCGLYTILCFFLPHLLCRQ